MQLLVLLLLIIEIMTAFERGKDLYYFIIDTPKITMHKLYVNQINHEFFSLTKIAADLSGVPVQVVIVSEEMAAEAAFKTKKAHGSFPFLETPEGTIIFESAAIAAYFGRIGNSDIIGTSAFEQAQINQWLSIVSMNVWPQVFKIYLTGYGMKYDVNSFNDGAKALKEQVKALNAHLGGERSWLVVDRLTLADLVMFIALIHPFRLVLDAGFRKAMPQAAEWFLKMSKLPVVTRTAGYVKWLGAGNEQAAGAAAAGKAKGGKADKGAKPKGGKKEAAPKKEEKKPAAAAADDDDFDPFAEDPEADAAAAEALKKKGEEAAAKKKKAAPIAKSIILWEVKPWGEETNLDELAQMILGIEMEGLVWKAEYKKEPVAFGIFKLIMGAVVEDDKVSTDLVQEKVEEFEDHVQSVDILSFNKL